MAFSKTVNDVLARVAKETGVDLALLRAFCFVESGGRPNVVSSSGYKGLFQLSGLEFKKHGGSGNILDPYQNAKAAAKKLKHEIEVLTKRYGRPPTGAELYLVHQQGMSGSHAHRTHPDRAAWASMHSTAEGKSRGSVWSRRAIWGNLTPAAKLKFRKVENVTSGDFVQFWTERFAYALEKTRVA